MSEYSAESDADVDPSSTVTSYVDEVMETVAGDSRTVLITDAELNTEKITGGPVLPTVINAESIQHITPDRITALNPDTIMPLTDADDELSRPDTPFKEVIQHGIRIENRDYTVTGIDGSIEHIRLTAKPIPDENNVTGAVFMIRRITDEIQTEEKLSELESIVGALGDAVYITNKHGEYEYVNDAFTELTGYSRDEITGKTPVEFKTDPSIERANQHRNRLLSAGGPSKVQFEITLETKDGGFIPCEEHMGIILSKENEFEGLAGVLRDISTLKQQEVEIERQQDTLEGIPDSEKQKGELERQKTQLDQFVSVLTHDLRNPMGIANGYLEMVKTEDNADFVEEIEDAHDRMEAIIEDTLALFEESSAVTDKEEVEIVTIAKSAWDNVDTGNSALQIVDEFTIQCNEKRAIRLFENLYRNAVEHNNSPVRITVGQYEPIHTTSCSDGENRFYVADNGVGIPEERRDEVFDFGETSSESGTGLGLPIIERVANAHDWDVQVRESANGGAKFVFI
jgi:PAS domain S-box-containing protein